MKTKRSFGNYLDSKESRHRTCFGIQGVNGFWVIRICLDPVSNGNSRDNRVKDISEVRERTERYIATRWYF